MEKSSPTPESATVCGLSAVSVIVSVPGLAPPTVGLKETLIEQLEPPAMLPPHALCKTKSDELIFTVMLSAAVPELVTVIFWGTPLVPTY
jgi:hypothetical protein